ncbi:MAG: hypothetical protein HPM95_04820 [Alphaproteobacteria bacterium]|nr:hypothetical protein [Alphaproteobacteria bacterium]
MEPHARPFQEGDFPSRQIRLCRRRRDRRRCPRPAGRDRLRAPSPSVLYCVPAEAALPLPDGVPAARGILAANMETALNGLWDGGALTGDHIAVVGGGIIGLLVAHLAARIPGTKVTVLDVDPAREARARPRRRLRDARCGAGRPGPRLSRQRHPDGLDTALSLAGIEARVVEMSWYGTTPVTAKLGGRSTAAG